MDMSPIVIPSRGARNATKTIALGHLAPIVTIVF